MPGWYVGVTGQSIQEAPTGEKGTATLTGAEAGQRPHTTAKQRGDFKRLGPVRDRNWKPTEQDHLLPLK